MAVRKTNLGLVELARVRACETSRRPASWTGHSYVERIASARMGATERATAARYSRIGYGTIDGWPSGVSGIGLSGGPEQHGQDIALDCQRGVVRGLRLGMPQDGVGVGVHDNRGVCTMA